MPEEIEAATLAWRSPESMLIDTYNPPMNAV